jgi:phospholipid N-methyltransferase
VGPVLELGSGTGAFVLAMLAREVAERDLTLVELDPSLAYRLAHRYPEARVVNGDAAAIDRHIGDDKFGAVICGLGLLNMPSAAVEAILKGPSPTWHRLRASTCSPMGVGVRCPMISATGSISTSSASEQPGEICRL